MTEEKQELIQKIADVEQLYSKVCIQETRFNLVETKLKSAEVELRSYIQQYFDDLLIGSVSAFAMKKAPEGWLECDGREVSRTQYRKLFARIGFTFGEGNGDTTFNLPDLRGEFIRGFDNSSHNDSGRIFGSKQVDQMQTHSHKDPGHRHTGKISENGQHDHSKKDASNSSSGFASHSGEHKHYGTIESSGSHGHSATASDNGSHDHGIKASYGVGRSGEYQAVMYGNCNNTDHDKNGYDFLSRFCSTKGEHSHEVSINYSGSHKHNLIVDSSGNHSHSVVVNPSGTHSHSVSIQSASASLGNPIGSNGQSIRHGNETRPRNLALLYCIKC